MQINNDKFNKIDLIASDIDCWDKRLRISTGSSHSSILSNRCSPEIPPYLECAEGAEDGIGRRKNNRL
jgi:hypothetical protein